MSHATSPARPRTVLIARFSAIGDVAMSVPVVYSVCRSNPDTRFVYITRPTMTGLMLNAPDNLTVVGVDVKQEYAGVKGLRRLFHRLRREYGFDVFADLHDVLRTKVLGALCRLHGIPVRVIDKGRARKRALTRRRNKVMLPLLSSRARYREVFYRIGLAVEERFDSLFGPDGAPAEAYAAISGPKRAGERWIAVAPFAKHEGKIYPRCDLPCRKKIRFPRRACTDEPCRCDGVDGLGQHASGIHRRHARGERLGRHSSILRLQGVETAGGGHSAALDDMPPLLRIRRQAMPVRRLPLPARHPPGPHRAQGARSALPTTALTTLKPLTTLIISKIGRQLRHTGLTKRE